MDRTNARQMLTKPQIQRLKQLTNDLEVGEVMGDRVLVKLVVPYTDMDRVEKEGLLAIPDSARDENTPLPTTGIVVAISPDAAIINGETGQPMLEEGTMIMFSKYAGSDVYFNEEAYRIMETKEILCTLRETKKAAGPTVVPFNVEPAPQSIVS